jgi:LmbE family N-acetylglucosaminyl deacetylase
MDDALRRRLDDVVAGGGGFLFLSAHLDDAVLSCGGLLRTLVGRAPVTVATVFTDAGPPPHTLATRAFLSQCGARDAAVLFAARQQEDADVLAQLGAECVHLGVPDALFRRRSLPVGLDWLGRRVPEVAHRYPTFRFDVARGRVSRGDRELLDRVDTQVQAIVDRLGPGLVFAPVGVGRHVDHLLTRQLGERHAGRLVLYSDFPYDRTHSPDAAYLTAHRLTASTWTEGVAAKLDLIRGYRTQVSALFCDGEIPVCPETYYLPDEMYSSSVRRPSRGA